MRKPLLQTTAVPVAGDLQLAAAQRLGTTLWRDPFQEDIVPPSVLKVAREDPDEEIRLAAVQALSRWAEGEYVQAGLLDIARTVTSAYVRRVAVGADRLARPSSATAVWSSDRAPGHAVRWSRVDR